MTRKILVTGFEPFGDQKVNASWEAVSRLPSKIDGVQIVVHQLPVVYYESALAVKNILDEHPDITDVLLVGEAGGISQIAVEMIAVNYDDSELPDNAGTERRDQPICKSGPNGLFASIPVKQIVQYLKQDRQIPAEVSWSAGQFLCNHTLYGVLEYLSTTGKSKIRAGFVHLPYLFEQACTVNRPGLPLGSLVKGIEAIVEYLIITDN